MAKPHKSVDNPKLTKIAKQAAEELLAKGSNISGKVSTTYKPPIKNPKANKLVHGTDL